MEEQTGLALGESGNPHVCVPYGVTNGLQSVDPVTGRGLSTREAFEVNHTLPSPIFL